MRTSTEAKMLTPITIQMRAIDPRSWLDAPLPDRLRNVSATSEAA
jgi:hypothetical protein